MNSVKLVQKLTGSVYEIKKKTNHVSKHIFLPMIADMVIRMTFYLRNIYCMSQKVKDTAFIIFQHMWQLP